MDNVVDNKGNFGELRDILEFERVNLATFDKISSSIIRVVEKIIGLHAYNLLKKELKGAYDTITVSFVIVIKWVVINFY